MTSTSKIAAASHVEVTHFGHTAIGIETTNCRVLIDPMMFSQIKWQPLAILARPAIRLDRPIDDVFISHAHTDHFHLPTLLLLNQTARFHLYGGDRADARMKRKVDHLRHQLDQLGLTQHDVLHAGDVAHVGELSVEAIAVPDSIDGLGQCAFLVDCGFASIFDGVDMLFDQAITQRLAQRDVNLAFLPSGYSQQSSAGRNQMTPFDAYKFARIVSPRFVAACGGAVSVHREQVGRPQAIASYPTGAHDWLPAIAAHGIATATPPVPSIYRVHPSLGAAPIISQEVLRSSAMPTLDAIGALYFSGYDFTDVVEPFDWLAANPDTILHQQGILDPVLASLQSQVALLSAKAAPGLNRTRFGQLAPYGLSLLHGKSAHDAIARCIISTPPFIVSKDAWIDACFLRWTEILEDSIPFASEIRSALATDHAWSQVHNNQSLLASTFPREPWIKDEVPQIFQISISNLDLALGVRIRLSDAARLVAEPDGALLLYPSRRGVETHRLNPAMERMLELAADRPLGAAIATSAQESGVSLEAHTSALLATINRLLALSTFTVEVLAPSPGDMTGRIDERVAMTIDQLNARLPAAK